MYLEYELLELLIGEEGGFVVSLGVGVHGSADGLEVLHSHTQHGQLVQLARHCVTHGNHGRQFRDVQVHLVSSSLFYLTVVLSEK